MVSDSRSKVAVATVLSAEQAAQKVQISYITLRRWLAKRDFQKWLTAEKKPPLAYLRLGKTRKVIWRFSSHNMLALVEYKEQVYCKGRGLAGRLREQVKRERNYYKNAKRMAYQYDDPSITPEQKKQRGAKERKRNLIHRQYDRIVKELERFNLRPKDSRLVFIDPVHPFDLFETPSM